MKKVVDLHIASRTHVGLRRESNQDFLAARSLGDKGMLLVVADGMGGHQGGERASRLAAESFINGVENGGEGGEELLTNALVAANNAVAREAAEHEELLGMGTTLVAALVREGRGTVINLGDSRAYLLRNGALLRVTQDHSMVADMVRRGEITEAEAEVHPRRNVLTRAVGLEGDPKPDLFTVDLEAGEILLLCTDGLHGMVDDRSIRKVLQAEWSLDARCDALVDAALDAGGKDNVTVLLAQRGDGGASASGPATDQGYFDDEQDFDEEQEADWNPSEGKGWLYLLIAVIVGLAVWGAIEYDLFTSGSDSVETSDTLGIDTTGLLLDSNVQLSPSDMVNDSIWSDSLSVPADRIRRDTGRRSR